MKRTSFAMTCLLVAYAGAACGGEETGEQGGGGTSNASTTSTSTTSTSDTTSTTSTTSPSTTSSAGGAGGEGGATTGTGGSGGAGGGLPDAVGPLLDLIPDDASWQDVPPAVQAALEARAKQYLAGVRAGWGAAGLAQKEAVLLGAPTKAMTDNIDAFVAYKFSNVVPDGFVASKDVANAQLRALLTKLALVYLAERRFFAAVFDGLKEWDGSEITEFLVWDDQALGEQKAYAEQIEADLRALNGKSLTTTEAAIADKAISFARQLTRGVTVYSYGGDDWIHTGTAADILYDYVTSYSSFFGSDDALFLETLNAGTWVSLVHMNSGTTAALQDSAIVYSDPIFMDDSGLPASSVAGKGLTKLANLWATRTAAEPDAAKLCTVYTPAQRAAMWDGFTADQLQDNANATTLEGYAASYGAIAAERLKLIKSAAKGAFLSHFPDQTVLDAGEKSQINASIDAETQPAAVLTNLYAKLDQVTGSTAASDDFKAEFDNLTTVGGYPDGATAVTAEDIATVGAMWADVKDYLSKTYGNKTVDIVSLLPADVNPTTKRGSFTGPNGEITLGLKAATAKTTVYGILLHEAKHVIDVKSGRNVEGAQLEGAALAAERMVLSNLLEDKMAAEAGKFPFYNLVTEIDNVRLTSTTDATLKVLLRDSCAPGSKSSIDFAKDVVASYGYTDDNFLTARAFRAHLNLQYLSYDYGLVIALDALDYLSAQTGTPVDPFLLQACDIFNLDKSAGTVAKLKTCLGK